MQTTSAPASHQHHDHLDGWRGLAIALLLIGHFYPLPGINLGSVGVSFFFVLSGHLMGQLLFVKKTPLPLFYKRRISRILPAHLIFIACMLLWFLVSGRAINFNETLAALFFVNNYWVGTPGQNVMPFGHIWSLSVEEHSYILLSLLAFANRSWRWSAKHMVGICCLVILACATLYWNRYSGRELQFDKWLHTEVAAFGIFVSVFFLLNFRQSTARSMQAPLWIALLAFGICMQWWSVPGPLQLGLGVSALALAVNLLADTPETLKKLLGWRPLRMLGLWSFSLYLWQQPFYHLSHADTLPRSVAFGLALACGLASYYGVEKPCREFLNRRWARNRLTQS